MSDRVEQIIEHLQGSCMSFSEACNSFDIESDKLTQEELEQIDDTIFCCEGCNWWCDVGERTLNKDEEPVCEDCKNE